MKLLISSILAVYLLACVAAQDSTEFPSIPSVPSIADVPGLNNAMPGGTSTNPLSNINTNLNSMTNGLSNSLPNNPLNGLQNGLSNSLPNNPLNGLQNSVTPSEGQQSGFGSGIFSGIMNSISGLARPLIDIGPSRVSDQGRHIGVNVPLIYSLDMDTRGAPGQSRLSSSTMMGMIKVDRDRVRGPDGKLQGPVQVSIMGLPIYSNGQTAPAPGTPAGPNRRGFNDLQNGLSNTLPNNPLNGLQNGLSNSLPSNANNLLPSGLSNQIPSVTPQIPEVTN